MRLSLPVFVEHVHLHVERVRTKVGALQQSYLDHKRSAASTASRAMSG
jgi:hypothetical protein